MVIAAGELLPIAILKEPEKANDYAMSSSTVLSEEVVALPSDLMIVSDSDTVDPHEKGDYHLSLSSAFSDIRWDVTSITWRLFDNDETSITASVAYRSLGTAILSVSEVYSSETSFSVFAYITYKGHIKTINKKYFFHNPDAEADSVNFPGLNRIVVTCKGQKETTLGLDSSFRVSFVVDPSTGKTFVFSLEKYELHFHIPTLNYRYGGECQDENGWYMT